MNLAAIVRRYDDRTDMERSGMSAEMIGGLLDQAQRDIKDLILHTRDLYDHMATSPPTLDLGDVASGALTDATSWGSLSREMVPGPRMQVVKRKRVKLRKRVRELEKTVAELVRHVNALHAEQPLDRERPLREKVSPPVVNITPPYMGGSHGV